MKNTLNYEYNISLMELLDLNDYNRQASLGKDYPHLDQIYKNWSRDLHAKGNYISNNNLQIISVNGLIRWYFKKVSFDIDYNFNNVKYYIDNPKELTFYDIKTIYKFGSFFDIHNIFIDNLELNKLNYKYEYLKKFNYTKKICKYYYSRFGVYLCDNIENSELTKYLTDVYNKYLKYIDFFQENSLFENFLKKYPKVIKWGIIYHKFKIILEKITPKKHKDIYKIDKFIELIQQYIYTLIFKYIENIKLNSNIDIYIINEELLDNEKYLLQYPDESLSNDFDFLIF